MTIIERGQASSCNVPALQLFAVDPEDGFMRDIASGSYVIKKPDGTEAQASTAINIADCPTGDRLGKGRYAAKWTVPTDASTTPTGIYTIEWTYVIENPAGTLNTYNVTRSFEVAPAGVGINPMGAYYASYGEVAELGLSGCQGKNATALLTLATQYIEKFTGNFFVPTPKNVRVDGTGSHAQLLREPIIAIADVAIDIAPFEPSDLPIDASSLRVYNRHIRQGLTRPDDRDNPKLEFYHAFDRHGNKHASFARLFFNRGEQNVGVEGVFGYTDPDGTPYGSTPALITRAALMLVVRNAIPISDVEARQDQQRAGQLEELRTRDQQVKWNFPSGVLGHHAFTGGFTGDPEIDTILMMYQKPIALART